MEVKALTAEQTLKFYDQQLAAADSMNRAMEQMTNAVERVGAAIQAAADRMGLLQTSTEKTTQKATNLKSPFDSMVKTMSSKAQEGISKLKTLLNPKTLLSGKSLLWPLAIDIGWQLFGNDIINILTPALTVLESFAGVVRGVLGTVAPLFAPVVGVLERMAAGLDWVAANMDALAPVIGGAAAALMVFNAKLIAGTIASWAHTAATAISSVTQKVFNTSLLACPLTWIALAIGVVIGLLYRWIQSVGGIRTAWAIVVDEVSYFLDKMDLGFMRTFYGILDYMGDFKVGFLTGLQDVVNGGIDLLNKLIENVNKLPGIAIPLIEQVTFGAEAALKNEEAKRARAETMAKWETEAEENHRLRQMRINEMKSKSAEEAGESALSAGTDPGAAAEQPNEMEVIYGGMDPDTYGVGGGLNVNHVESLGRVENEVSVAKEDLDLMRDVAEMRFLQNFVSLTPTVTLNARVDRQVDVDAMLRTIERKLEEEILMSAEGAYL